MSTKFLGGARRELLIQIGWQDPLVGAIDPIQRYAVAIANFRCHSQLPSTAHPTQPANAKVPEPSWTRKNPGVPFFQKDGPSRGASSTLVHWNLKKCSY